MSFERYFEIDWEPKKSKMKLWTSRKSGKMASWEPLGRFLGLWRVLVGISSEVGAKISARWAKLGPSWRQVASKMGHDGAKMGHDSAKMGHDSAKMGILDSTWELSGAFWRHFLTISAPGLESEKP